MERLVKFIDDRPVLAVATLGIAAYCTVKVTKAAFGIFVNPMAQLETRPEHYEDGIIYMHLFPRSLCRQHLNLSPFVIKLESWLRLRKIPYKNVETFQVSKSTSQIPYIIWNGEETADSNKIMHFLEKKMNIPEDEGLNKEQLAVSHSLLRLLDESFGWTYGTLRYLHYDFFYTDYMRMPGSRLMQYLFTKQMKSVSYKKLITHGIGRKTVEDITEIAKDDIRAISRYLDNKNFLMGDAITKVDCAVFAHLSQVVFNDIPFPHKKIIEEECPNILPYMDRLKEQLWPDWDELVIP